MVRRYFGPACGQFGLWMLGFVLGCPISGGLRHQYSPHHVQIGQRSQCEHLGCVLGQPAIAHPTVTELTFDNAKDVFDLGADRTVFTVALRLRR